MRVEQLGAGEPSVAVVGAIHGDEPCGVTAIDRLLASEPPIERPVKLIVANERALAAEQRYCEEDLNRAFPGDTDGSTHESRLAAELAAELDGCTTLALHSTQSYEEPFAIVRRAGGRSEELARRLPVEAIVETGPFDDGRLFQSVETLVEVEAGYQGSTVAADNATRVVREFLRATGVLADQPPLEPREHEVYRLDDVVPKREAEEYEVYVSNFERVEAGDAFAAADGERVVADEPFYPVLLSAYGYEDVFGYTAKKRDNIV
ncbi:succinylglutamate desuccinylase/aspartoacylase domain-containing protein [Halapricum desulfuricans]|nr:succinylglutamate desuccinylase/aspartoacylase family protein [Halapricum desulfuricans]